MSKSLSFIKPNNRYGDNQNDINYYKSKFGIKENEASSIQSIHNLSNSLHLKFLVHHNREKTPDLVAKPIIETEPKQKFSDIKSNISFDPYKNATGGSVPRHKLVHQKSKVESSKSETTTIVIFNSKFIENE
jgi:hypothetical protein